MLGRRGDAEGREPSEPTAAATEVSGPATGGRAGTEAAPAAGLRPTRQQNLLLVAITLSVALGFIDTTAVGVALPSMQRDFDTSTVAAHWVVLAFLLTSASLVAAGGRAGDLLGRRRVYLFGLGLFAVASLICGTATDE